MIMKYSSALLAVVISTMMGTTEAINIAPADPTEVTSAVFKIADKDKNSILTKKEFKRSVKKLLKSDDVPGDKSFLNDIYKVADMASGQDDKVTYDDLLATFTEALGGEAAGADEADEAEEEEEDDEAEEADEVVEEEKAAPEEEVEEAEVWDGSGSRCFIDPIFESSEIQILKDVQYGSAYNPKTKQQQDLLLDVYLPPDSDTRTLRPAVVWMHGGAFVKGVKESGKDLATELAMRGYAVFTITYRLAGKVKPEEQLERLVA